ncbi:Histone deacetylase hda1 [Oleoguttula sp. CCFEE 5521]
MDLDDSGDAFMDDAEVISSTEHTGLPTITLGGSSTGPASTGGNGNNLGSSSSKAGSPANPAVFDQHLTGLKDAPRPPKFKNLPYASLQTGLVYDVRMRFHVELFPEEVDVHPEDPRRIYAIFEAFVEAGLAWRDGVSDLDPSYYMGRIDARQVTEEEVRLVHTKAHFDWVQSLSTKPADDLREEEQHPGNKMDSIYLSPATPYSAALSAGGAIEACRAIMLGKVKNAFAVIRPPGHHAEREDAKGFCFYDNVSIATKVCQREFGSLCRKVFILDWDVHHGNGIQQASYNDPNVLYVSLHVHKKGTFYPESSYRDNRPPYGNHLHCGEGAGLGMNVNVPWTAQGMGDADYLYAFQQVIMPIAQEFDPDLVIIAAGFDAAEGDMLGGCKVTPAGYAHMTHMLMSLANGRIAACLEGGYNLDSIARSATAVVKTMMGEQPDRLVNTTPSRTGIDDVKLVLRQQSKFWGSLHPKDPAGRVANLHGERMHDIVRKWQATTLWDEYHMTPLFINRESLSGSFENQVLATANYTEARPMLVILHDPPEMLASVDPRTGDVELHNTWVTDPVKTYTATAVRNGFSVIDVNMPKHVTEETDTGEHEEVNVGGRVPEATELLQYLWDNYIMLSDATHIFLMGTNIGHWAITLWIKANEDAAIEYVTKTVSFITDVALQACRSHTNDLLSPWYAKNSQVYVARSHNWWSLEFSQRPKKKFGKLMENEESGMSEMLQVHKDTVFEMLLAETAAWRASRDDIDDDEMTGQDAVDEGAIVAPAASGLPPVKNFAPSPVKPGESSTPTGAGVRSPGLLSPTKVTGSFSARQRTRSPGM